MAAGVEAFAPPRYWLFDLLGWGARVEFSELFDDIRVGGAGGRDRVTARRGELAVSLVFGW